MGFIVLVLCSTQVKTVSTN